MRFQHRMMGLQYRKGSAVTDLVISAAIIAFIILPVFSAVMEKYIIQNKAQIIKDAVDMTNVSTYNAIKADSLGRNKIELDAAETEEIYSSLLAANLRLDNDLKPLKDSIAEGKVTIDSLVIYTDGFPLYCPDGCRIERPSVHSCVTVPVKPSLYRQVLLDLLGKDLVELKVHVDSDIPVNN